MIAPPDQSGPNPPLTTSEPNTFIGKRIWEFDINILSQESPAPAMNDTDTCPVPGLSALLSPAGVCTIFRSISPFVDVKVTALQELGTRIDQASTLPVPSALLKATSKSTLPGWMTDIIAIKTSEWRAIFDTKATHWTAFIVDSLTNLTMWREKVFVSSGCSLKNASWLIQARMLSRHISMFFGTTVQSCGIAIHTHTPVCSMKL